jgi:hypothetical protein
MTQHEFGGFGSRRKRNVDLSKVRSVFSENTKTSHGLHWETAEEDFEKDTMVEEEHEIEIEDDEGEPRGRSYNVQTETDQTHLLNSEEDDREILRINGREVHIGTVNKKAKFEDTHVRFTSYLEKNLYVVVRQLKKQGSISSITELVNESIKQYLTSLPK